MDSYVTTLDKKWDSPLLHLLQEQGCVITTPLHTKFSAKKPGLTCTLYTSGKLVIQGKNHTEFVEFYLEPQILQTFSSSAALESPISHIGIDESGKGDFFGPLCIAGVYVKQEQYAVLHAHGVKDSKALSDETIHKLAAFIKKECLYHIVKINPPKYNQIYADFKNLNTLLAWGHATAIEQLVEHSGCREVLIDQFADERVVERALKRKALSVQLTQRHKGEEDLAVAAASILARDTFVTGLEELSKEAGILLPKGCSAATTKAGKAFVKKWGKEKLPEVGKMHFKTSSVILDLI